MKRITAFLLCAVLALTAVPYASVAFATSEKTAGAREEIEFSDPYVTGITGSYPRFASIGSGDILFVHGGSQSLTVRRSSDGGESWSEPVVAVNYEGTNYSPANGYLYYDAVTEKVFLSFRCPITNEDGTYTANVMICESTDRGESWSEPFCMLSSTVPSAEEYGGAWEPTIYRTDGKLRMYYSGNIVKYGDGQVKLNAGTENEITDTTYPYSSSKVVQYIVVHELDEESGAWGGGAITFDGYPSHPYKPYEGYVYRRAGMQSISLLSDGTYVMAIESSRNANASQYGGTSYPMVIDVCFSRDGLNFTEPKTIAVGHAEGYTSAAPWVVTLPDGRIAVSFQTDDHHDEPHPTAMGNYKQLNVVVSRSPVSYADAYDISEADFERYTPFEKYNSEVTYNYWNGLYIDGYKLYAVGNVSTNDSKVTKAMGICFSVADLTPEGVPEGYTPICTANDLTNLMHRESGWGWFEDYILLNDIDLADATNGLEQTPIGYQAVTGCYFYGTFDGNSKKITGIDIDTDARFAGLFGYVMNSTVRDLELWGEVSSSYYTKSRVNNGVGGLCGFANGNTVISGITSCVNVSAKCTAGGIAGYILRNGTGKKITIKNCDNRGTVTSTATSAYGAAGGIVGSVYALTADIEITDCNNYGGVSGYQYVGGIVGASTSSATEALDSVRCYVTRCENYGGVTGSYADIGGIYGMGWAAVIRDCVNHASVVNTGSASSAYLTAGIIGRAHQKTEITRCVNTGKVSEVGRAVLANKSLGTENSVQDCYYINRGEVTDAFAASLSESSGAVCDSYAGYDFINTFVITDGEISLIDRYSLRAGDSDGDGLLTNADITLIVRVLSGYKEQDGGSCDADGNGRVNNRDALSLIFILAGYQR